MRTGIIPLVCGLIILIIIVLSVLPAGDELRFNNNKPVVTLVYATSGMMPQLLNTSQVDAFIVWESVVSTAELGDIGKVIARDADFPPDHKWENSACNVLVMRNEFIKEHPEISAFLSAVTIAGMNQIQQDPDDAKNITANWVYGKKPILTAGLYLNPDEVENEAFQHIIFTDSASLPDISRLISPIFSDNGTEEEQTSYMNESVMNRAEALLNGSEPQISGKPPTVKIGYLPSSDLYAPLYVTIMDYKTICDKYGFCLAPEPGYSGRPTKCRLMLRNQTIANVQLMPGSVGGGVMTGLGQDAMDAAYIGSVPSMLQISMGNNASIVQSVNAGGSGLVVNGKAPCNDWNSFISWVKLRSAIGKPVLIAVPQSSIQEEMIREAFEYEGIQIILYGLPPMEVI
jgi:ABC-type nitrate/sulfonate/bicarbonate transport system substrate-binding protein